MLPDIASLWLGPRLTFLEQLCLKSFADAGHRTVLFSYERIENLPDGVERGDARDVLELGQVSHNKFNGSPASYADKFRYHLLAKTDFVWVDTDAYCLRPLPNKEHLFAIYYGKSINNSVLRLPKDSATLAHLLDFVSSDYPDLPKGFYQSRPVLVDYRRRRKAGEEVHISELDHETWGPYALTYFLMRTGEYDFAMQPHTLNPITAYDIGKVIRPRNRVNIDLPDDCCSIHLYGTRLRQILRKFGGRPLAGSLMAELCDKHDIDIAAAPIN